MYIKWIFFNYFLQFFSIGYICKNNSTCPGLLSSGKNEFLFFILFIQIRYMII